MSTITPRTFTGEIITTDIRAYAVFEGEWFWGNRAMMSAGGLQNALVWESGQRREESLKALAALRGYLDDGY